ncbi:50S ribosomal protein L21e [Nanoarchaeota archaeon]
MQRVGGQRRKTRYKLQKPARTKGKISLTKYFQKLEIGDKVKLKAEPAQQKGMYFPRYHGKVGTVKNKKGFCYEITIKDRKKTKNFIVHPVHLIKVS